MVSGKICLFLEIVDLVFATNEISKSLFQRFSWFPNNLNIFQTKSVTEDFFLKSLLQRFKSFQKFFCSLLTFFVCSKIFLKKNEKSSKSSWISQNRESSDKFMNALLDQGFPNWGLHNDLQRSQRAYQVYEEV